MPITGAQWQNAISVTTQVVVLIMYKQKSWGIPQQKRCLRKIASREQRVHILFLVCLKFKTQNFIKFARNQQL